MRSIVAGQWLIQSSAMSTVPLVNQLEKQTVRGVIFETTFETNIVKKLNSIR